MASGERYLVTGGLGFLGASLVRRLVKEGHTVRVLDNSFRGSAQRLGNVAADVEIISGDIRDARVVDAATRNMDSVCHLAFVNGTQYFYDRPAYVLDVGVKGMVNVLDACIRRGVQDLILASSSEVYQTPPRIPTDESVSLSVPDVLNARYSYAGGKIISELMTLNYGRQYLGRVVIFRPHNVFGPDMGSEHVIPELALRMSSIEVTSRTVDFPIQGDGRDSRAFIYLDDFIEGLIRVVENGRHMEIYNIGTTDERTISDVARQIAAIFELKIKFVPGGVALGGTKRRCPSIEKIRELGFAPRWKFEDALRITVDWYRQHANDRSVSAARAATLFIPELQ